MIRLKGRLVLGAVGALSVALLAGSGVRLVLAHTGPPPGPGVIHSCANNASGEVKIVGANDTCNNNATALDWNIQGPAGPMGPQGPQGIQGLPGPSGLAGLQTVYSATSQSTDPVKSVSAVCPTGKTLIGGGGFISPYGSIDVHLQASWPNGNEWTAAAEGSSTGSGWTLVAVAICANVAS